MLLSAAGHRVREADGFASALAVARDEPLDVLITDIGLPDGDGCDLLARVSALRSVKAVAVSGYAGPEHVERFRAAGFDAFVAKPLDADALLTTVRAVAADDRRTSPAPASR